MKQAGSIPGGDIYFHFDFFTSLPSQLGGAHANETSVTIYLPVVTVLYVVWTQDTSNHTRPMHILVYHPSIA